MLIRKCDRCGKEYIVNSIKDIEAMYTVIKKPTNPLVDYDKPNDNKDKNMAWDICEKCIESFETWMKKTDISPVKVDLNKKITFEDLHNEPINPFIEEEAEINERIALETQMNNAYARGNDRLGDSIAERLDNMSNKKDKTNLFRVRKPHKRPNSRYHRLFVLFDDEVIRDLFVLEYGKCLSPFSNQYAFDYICRYNKKYNVELSEVQKEELKRTMKKGYYFDVDNPLMGYFHVKPNEFNDLIKKGILLKTPAKSIGKTSVYIFNQK